MRKTTSKPVIALVGNPNCGKTTLFNALTGAWQRVGNWAGVTVEGKAGFFNIDDQRGEVVDLPGTYTLTTFPEDGPEDETFTCEFLKKNPDCLVFNVVDASNLARNLYLTLQLLEQNNPMIIALNRIDLAERQGNFICPIQLSAALGCQVIPLIARKGVGIESLKAALTHNIETAPFNKISYPPIIEEKLTILSQAYEELMGVSTVPRYQLIRWLEGEVVLPCALPLTNLIADIQTQILAESGHPADVLIATARYEFIDQVVAKACKKQPTRSLSRPDLSRTLDKIICHRFFGLPIFLAVMYGLFFFAINIGGAFQDFFELTADLIFVESVTQGLTYLNAPQWLMALLVSGVGKGVSTILTFVPVLGAMFLALAFLEDCGYMARAAFVMDRLMRTIGLPGKSFVPMIVGFGCNVPAIMGTRTLENKRDRILAVMMSPFMSCGARLAIFTVFVAAFYPQGGQNIVFLLYLIGILLAIATGLLLKKTLLKGDAVPLLLEMPNYQWPHWKSLWFHCWHRLRRFVINAGKLILPVCMIIGALNSINMQGKWLNAPDNTSLLSVIGQQIVPVFKPLGIEEDNWPAAVGLLTGILAKEVVIGTLNSLYAQSADKEVALESFSIGERLLAAVATIPNNLRALVSAQPDPDARQKSSHVYGEMVQRFHSQENAFAYLLFVLLYFPCVSATAAMLREVQKGWTGFSICWTTGLAYTISVTYYQTATFITHPFQSSVWILFCVGCGLLTLLGIRWYGRHYLPRIVPTTIVLV